MTRLSNSPSKISRIYLVFLDENSDKITLSFRNEKSVNNFINQYKISKNRIVYKSNMRPNHFLPSMSSLQLEYLLSLLEHYLAVREGVV